MVTTSSADEVAAHISKSAKPSKGQGNDAKDEVVDDSAASDVLSLLKQLPADGATAAAAIAQLSGQRRRPEGTGRSQR
jgi:chemotaxis protein MotD